MAHLPDLPIMESDLTSTEKLVLWVLKFHLGSHETTWVSHTTIARRCSITPRCVRKVIVQLIAKGWINMESGKDLGKTNIYTLNKDRFSLKKVGTTILPPMNVVPTPYEPGSYPLGTTFLHKNNNEVIIKGKDKIQSALQKSATVSEVLSGNYNKGKSTSLKATTNGMILAYKNFVQTEFGVPIVVKETDKVFFYAFKKKMPVEINCTEQLLFCLKNWSEFKYYIATLFGDNPKGSVPGIAYIAKYAEHIVEFKGSIDTPIEKEKHGLQTTWDIDSSGDFESPAAKKKKAKKEALEADIEGGKYG